MPTYPLEIAVIAAAAAACVAFLWWNTSSARIIMGDVGSLGLGGLIGCPADPSIRKSSLSVVVVAQQVGHKKPAPEIFHAAAGIAQISLRDAWVIGDSPQADIAGAVALGLQSVWVSNNRTWSQEGYEPTEISSDVASAIHRVLARRVAIGDP